MPRTQEILFKSCWWFCSSKTSIPLDKKEVFEFEKKKLEDSEDDTDVQVVSDEKADENNLSKAEKKKKLAEKTKSFKNFLEKNVEREVISESSHFSVHDDAVKNVTKFICDYLGSKEEPSWTLAI